MKTKQNKCDHRRRFIFVLLCFVLFCFFLFLLWCLNLNVLLLLSPTKLPHSDAAILHLNYLINCIWFKLQMKFNCDEVQIKSVSLSPLLAIALSVRSAFCFVFQIWHAINGNESRDTKETKRDENKYNTEQNITKYLHTNELHIVLIMPLPVQCTSFRCIVKNSQKIHSPL